MTMTTILRGPSAVKSNPVADPTARNSWRDVLKVHPAAELFPMMSEAELVELGEDIKRNGLQRPISVIFDDAGMWVLDGRNRLDAIERGGFNPIDTDEPDRGFGPLDEDLGLPEHLLPDGIHNYCIDHVISDDPWAYVISANLHRRHLTTEQKRDLIARVLKARPQSSNNSIANQIKVDDKTVAKVRRELEGRSEIPNVEVRTDTKGRQRPATKQPPLRCRTWRSRQRPTASPCTQARYHRSGTRHPALSVSEVLGAVDLDPCWHPNSPVRATTTYTEEQNGLSVEWHGRLFLNPPYGRAIDAWIEKLVSEHVVGRVIEAVALVPARVDTEWFRRLDAFPRCFLRGRLTFANAENPAPFPSAAVYIGENVAKFAATFGRLGSIWVRLDDDGIPPFLRRAAS
jgi:DNA N-6-adenine-methyltransferase (Dam)